MGIEYQIRYNKTMTTKTEKRIQDFKKKNQKYLKARAKTDKQISVTRPGQKKPIIGPELQK